MFEKQSNVSPRWFKIAMALLILSVVATIFSFIRQFYNQDFSANVEHWGQTGDFIGGFLNPLVSGMTLLVTIYIAQTVNNLSTVQSKAALQVQRKLIVAQLQNDRLKAFVNELNILLKNISSKRASNDGTAVLDLIREILDTTFLFYHSERHLFFELEKMRNTEWQAMLDSLWQWRQPSAVLDEKYLVQFIQAKDLCIERLYNEMLDSTKIDPE